jgi:uncharacterized pyridoxal phosphate-containing UPF0001 family protein
MLDAFTQNHLRHAVRRDRLVVKEEHIEYGFIGKLQKLKYEYRAEIRDRAALERNFREKFEAPAA